MSTDDTDNTDFFIRIHQYHQHASVYQYHIN